jgi:[ribosomal protein S5]-alanine N-acetyltransferase
MMSLDGSYWDRFPTLETERLILREITPADSGDIFAIYSDEEVMRYWGSPPHRSMAETRMMIEGVAASYLAREGIRWGIARKPDDRLVGSCGLWRIVRRHFRAEIGYELSRSAWGQGIMAETIEAIARFGFVSMGLHSIEAQVDPENARSARLLEKARFKLEGRQRENFYYNGRFTDTLLYGRLCQD